MKYIIAFLAAFTFAIAGASAAPSMVAYYSFDGSMTDSTGLTNSTGTPGWGFTSNSSCIIAPCGAFLENASTGNWSTNITALTTPAKDKTNFAFNWWSAEFGTFDDDMIWSQLNTTVDIGSRAQFGTYGGTNYRLAIETGSSALSTANSNSLARRMWTVMSNSSGTFIYKDGVLDNSTTSIRRMGTGNLSFGWNRVNANDMLTGVVDEWSAYNESLTAAQVSCLYNAGAGTTYAQAVSCIGGSSSATNLTITAIDFYNSTSIASFNATITGTGDPMSLTDKSGNGNTLNPGSGASYNRSGTSYSFNVSSGDVLSLSNPDVISLDYSSFSTLVFIPSTIQVGDSYVFEYGSDTDFTYMRLRRNSLLGSFRWEIEDPTVANCLSSSTAVSSGWRHFVGVRNGTQAYFYLDGVNIDNDTSCGTVGSPSSPSLFVGGGALTGETFNGTIKNLAIYNRSLSSSEVQDLYNNLTPSSDSLYFYYNFSNFGTINYSTTTGTISTNITTNSSLPSNITIESQNYFSNVTNGNTNSTFQTIMTPFTAVRAFPIGSSTAITSFSVNYTNNANTSESGVVTTSSAVAYVPLYNATYLARIYDASNGSTNFATESANLTANPYLHSYNFSLYLTNSLFITFYDENNNSLFNQTTVTAFISGAISSYNYTTSTGYINATLLNPQNYTITYYATGYDQREYSIELTNQTYQSLSLYLLNSTSGSLVLVSVVDTASAKVEDAIIYLNKKNLSGTNYYTVETCTTDANGECLINPLLYTTTYNILVSYDGVTRYESGDTKISQTSLLFVINRGEQALQTYYEIANIEGSLVTQKLSNNTIASWSATYTNPELTGQAFMLQINSITGGVRTQLYAVNGTGSSGTLSYNTSITTAYDELEARLIYITEDGEQLVLQTSSITTGSFEQRMGRFGLFLFGFLFLGFVSFASISAGATGFLLSIPLVFTVMQIIGIGALGWGSVALMWAMAAIVWGLIKK